MTCALGLSFGNGGRRYVLELYWEEGGGSVLRLVTVEVEVVEWMKGSKL